VPYSYSTNAQPTIKVSLTMMHRALAGDGVDASLSYLAYLTPDL